jgi:hypothetical protein
MNKNGNLEDRVGVEMDEVEAVEEKEALKKPMAGGGEPPEIERGEDHDLLDFGEWPGLTQIAPPSYQLLCLEQPFLDKAFQVLVADLRWLPRHAGSGHVLELWLPALDLLPLD